jgi:putative ABC transport system permease protein
MSITQDVRFALRTMTHNPGFTFVVILTLALGIGATTAIFSVANGVILRPLPYKEPDRLVQIWSENKVQGIEKSPVAYSDWLDIRGRSKLLQDVACYEVVGYNLWGNDPERLSTGLASHEYFDALGAKVILGRMILPTDEVWGNHRGGLMSYSLWKRRFNSDPNIVGQSITMDGVPFKIHGVLGPEHEARPVPNTAEKPELWRTFAFPPNAGQENRSYRPFWVLARLKPGVTYEQAQKELDNIAGQLAKEYPEYNRDWGLRLVPMPEGVFGNFRRAIYLLAGAVAFVLLIACVNVANLLLARAEARDREIAIRNALGANRRRLIQQLLVESVMLALVGGGLGLLLARWALGVLKTSYADVIPRLEELALDNRALVFALGTTLLTVFLFGLVPALKGSRVDSQSSLRQQGAGATAPPGRHRLSLLLVVCEVALALVLLVGAGLLIRTFNKLQNTDPGFRTDHLLTLEMAMPHVKYGEDSAKYGLLDRLLPQLAAIPGVEGAAAVQFLPLKEPIEPTHFWIDGRPAQTEGEVPQAYPNQVSPSYFSLMGMALRQGRGFTEQDRIDKPQVALVNQTLAQRYWPNENPVGKRISFLAPGTEGHQWVTVVGVLQDIRHASLDAEPVPEIYAPMHQGSFWTFNLVVRAKGDPEALAPAVRQVLKSVDPDQAVYQVQSMEKVTADTLLQRRFSLFLLSIFAAIALVLAAVGVYGVMAYSVAQRSQEIGLRMALGAQRDQVLKLVVNQGMRYVIAGLVIGLVLSFALSRFLESLLYGIATTDLATFAGVVVLMGLVALLANYLPARRASKVSPIVALKS